MQRQALEELQRAKPPTDPDPDRAHAAILEDFARLWDAEPAERRRLLLSLFAQVRAKDDKS